MIKGNPTPDRRLRIRFKDQEEETGMFDPEKSSFLLKNLKYAKKQPREKNEPGLSTPSKKPVQDQGKRGIPNIGNTCYMYFDC